MLRSMYSGVSGMRNFQTKMDVIANNIANVNTTAFKSGRASFQDLMSQTVATAQSPQAGGRGGVNSQQIGLGVRVGSIDTIMENGAMQPTNRGLDFGIAGEGFFTVSPDGGATHLYTRDGAFYADYDGNLVNSAGLKIMGFGPPATGANSGIFKSADKYGEATNAEYDLNSQVPLKVLEKLYKTSTTTGAPPVESDKKFYEDKATAPNTAIEFELQSFNIDGTGIIKGVYKGENAAGEEISEIVILGQISLTTFPNPSGLTKDGGNNYIKSNNSGEPDLGQAGSGSKGTINQGFLEMSNVDLANEFTEMIVTSRAYQANSRSITTSDEMIQELLNLKR